MPLNFRGKFRNFEGNSGICWPAKREFQREIQEICWGEKSEMPREIQA
ncbi:uncharacterized protein METZ01_LOCUS209063 [marine metagenome]|uniref:Uncharacterized protein n=1 Tax=marine metagenome TaxID=408172 RepID=A0A382F0K8_9ZZZZ